MNYVIIAKNNKEEIQRRVNDFSNPKFFNALKKGMKWDSKTLNFHARHMVWSQCSKAEADRFAQECRDAPNNFLSVKVVKDDSNKPLNRKRILELLKK